MRNCSWLAIFFALLLLPVIANAQAVGTIQTVAGTYKVAGFTGDGGPAQSALLGPVISLASDSKGNIFLSDTGSARIRRIDAITGIITTYAGDGMLTVVDGNPATGITDLAGDGGLATSASILPAQLAVDASDNLYSWNPDIGTIRKISSKTNTISTVARPGGLYIDCRGFAVTADGSTFFLGGGTLYKGLFDTGAISVVGTGPYGGTGQTVVNLDGDVFVSGNPDGTVTRIDLFGASETIAEGLADPYGLALDSAGNVYVNQIGQIIKLSVKNAWTQTTIAGNVPAPSFTETGDGGAALSATITAFAICADPSGNVYFSDLMNYVIRRVNATAHSPVNSTAALTSAASSQVGPLAAGSIVSAYGTDLSTGTASGTSLPLPTTLSGTTVDVTDSNGDTKPAPLFFVSPDQVNFQIPLSAAYGSSLITIASGDGTTSSGSVTIAAVAPGLFVLNPASLVAANVITVNANGSTVFGNDFQIINGSITALAVNLGPPAQEVYLVLYGTGIAGRSSLSNVTVNLGGLSLPVAYAGPQGDAGLDQVNVQIPLSLVGIGNTKISVTVDGITSNASTISIM